MSNLARTDFVDKFADVLTGLFKDNNTNDIDEDRMRQFVTDIADSFTLLFSGSFTITRNEGTGEYGVSVSLANDADDPGADKYWGTDENGDKGFYAFPDLTSAMALGGTIGNTGDNTDQQVLIKLPNSKLAVSQLFYNYNPNNNAAFGINYEPGYEDAIFTISSPDLSRNAGKASLSFIDQESVENPDLFEIGKLANGDKFIDMGFYGGYIAFNGTPTFRFYPNQLAVGSSATQNDCAALSVGGTNRGFLLPRLTTVQRNSIQSPIAGLEIFNTDLQSPEVYTNNGWVALIEGNQTKLTTLALRQRYQQEISLNSYDTSVVTMNFILDTDKTVDYGHIAQTVSGGSGITALVDCIIHFSGAIRIKRVKNGSGDGRDYQWHLGIFKNGQWYQRQSGMLPAGKYDSSDNIMSVPVAFSIPMSEGDEITLGMGMKNISGALQVGLDQFFFMSDIDHDVHSLNVSAITGGAGTSSENGGSGELVSTEIVDVNGLSEIEVTFDKPRAYINASGEIKINISASGSFPPANYEIVQTIYHKSASGVKFGPGITMGTRLQDSGYVADGTTPNQINLHKINGRSKVVATIGSDEVVSPLTSFTLPDGDEGDNITVTYDSETNQGNIYFIWLISDSGLAGTFTELQKGYNLDSYTLISGQEGKTLKVQGYNGKTLNNASVLSGTITESNTIVVGGGASTLIQRWYTTSESNGSGKGGFEFEANDLTVAAPNLVAYTGTAPGKTGYSGISEPSPDDPRCVVSYSSGNILKFIEDRPFGSGNYKARLRVRSGTESSKMGYIYPEMKMTLKVNGVSHDLELVNESNGDSAEYTAETGKCWFDVIISTNSFTLNETDNEFEVSCTTSYWCIDYLELERIS